ncbi:hypothetical protein [Streptomyces cylindrosporus]|nr:hypothetical protein [Streptomyces cylindrosporus]
MAWPDGIAAVLGLIAAYLIIHHQHRSTTAQHTDPQDGEPHS